MPGEQNHAPHAANDNSVHGPSGGRGAGWHFWIDRGGTFTDIVARRPDGRLVTHKLLSEDPAHYHHSALHGIRQLLGLGSDLPIPPGLVGEVRMGTTIATNALLERKGEPVVLAITRGFADALRIADQQRPRIFDLEIRLPEMLYGAVVEIDERLGADGALVTPLDRAAAERDLVAAFDAGYRAVAVVLMHGYRYPRHEQRLGDLARSIGYTQISLSHRVSPLMKLVPRGNTTVADAYLSPVLRRYVDSCERELGGSRLAFMQSNGGLVTASRFSGKDAILSGPAGGVVGAVRSAKVAGWSRVIGFDMGGTSTDVWHYAGDYERRQDAVVAGVRITVPMLEIHTIAAGGGSVLHSDGARMTVGPDSAGADPGPACYRRGGPATVTDCQVVLGRLRPEYFPKVFGPEANQPIDGESSRKALATLTATAESSAGSVEERAAGFLRIAIDNMAHAIRKVSVQRGYDVREYLLAGFGSAAGQHVCAVADALGMRHILLPPFAGVLSAYGIGVADHLQIRQAAIELPLTEDLLVELDSRYRELAEDALQALAAETSQVAGISLRRRLRLRYQGSDCPLTADFGNLAQLLARFESLHRQHYGFTDPDRPLIVQDIAVEVAAPSDISEEPLLPVCSAPLPEPIESVPVYLHGEYRPAPVFRREDLQPGHRIAGPALVVETTTTLVLEPGWMATITPLRHLLLERQAVAVAAEATPTEVSPVRLELFNNAFMAVAEQMGAVLENTAHSVNIKERLDFSCALFDRLGRLVANAPHVPVHLGSMGESVRAVIAAAGTDIAPGDAYALNSPYHGGTHLPDITVVSPVYLRSGGSLLGWIASRGHHADVGGISPGSMPASSRRVDQEGVLLEPTRIVSGGRLLEVDLVQRLTIGPYPVRNPAQNLADLKAQLAANRKGADELQKLANCHGEAAVTAYMAHVQSYAEHCVRRLIFRLAAGEFRCPMDNGSAIQVRIVPRPGDGRVLVDFTGTSAQTSDNFNAPPAVCRAAVLYVLRTLVAEDIPLNDGFLRPVDLMLPEGSLLTPVYPAATVAGNVETSQVITDCLYGALGILAASQGTMNNLSFGNDRLQYYETIAGGSGAGQGFAGASAVQTHMTNSRLTDPEVLEWRFPVRLEKFSIRAGSGGAGRWHGGDGVVRQLLFLRPMAASVLSNRRATRPHGLAGGEPGQAGSNQLQRRGGTVCPLAATVELTLEAGDRLLIATPGGGGYGPAPPTLPASGEGSG
ncbi:MAG: 5-oxoprolinase [Methylococcaceae bacterium]|nr:5-oxoprolinase [Methylococcaceae bacterium]